MLTIAQAIKKGLAVVTALALVFMMLHVVLHALMRFFFAAPLYGTNEYIAFWYMPFLVLLGIPAAQLDREHINVTLVSGRMKSASAKVYKVFSCVLSGIVSLGFAWYGLKEAMRRADIGYTAGVTDIITWPMHFTVPLAFTLVAVLYLFETILILRTGEPEIELLTGKPAPQEAAELPVS